MSGGRMRILWPFIVVAGLVAPAALRAQSSTGDLTFTKDIVPVLQRSCQPCHHPNGVAPMSLVTYEEVRPWARAMRLRTNIGPHAGVMPPWFVEKDIGIQKFKNDPSLSDQEISKIVKWVDAGAPRGNPSDMPPPLSFDDSDKWTIGEPDLVLKSKEVAVPARGPDWWGDVGLIPTSLTEDRYVSALEVREINDIPRDGPTKTVGGRFVFHHMTYVSMVADQHDSISAEEAATSWPIHEVGRNADIFPPESGRLLAANSSLSLTAGHIHPNGRETKAHLEFAFKFFPKGYKPLFARSTLRVGNGHNWVKQYVYDDDAAPLLPKGTVVHLIGFLDTTPANKNPADPRNWAGGGRRSVANMFIDLGYSVALTEEQFQSEMAKRRAQMKSRNDYDIGCPLCWAPPTQTAPPAQQPQ